MTGPCGCASGRRLAGPVRHGLDLVVLLAWGGSRLPVIPLNWLAIAGAGSELARPREQLAHGAACRGIRSPRGMLRALLWAIAGGVRPDGAPASLMWIAEQRCRDRGPAAVQSKFGPALRVNVDGAVSACCCGRGTSGPGRMARALRARRRDRLE